MIERVVKYFKEKRIKNSNEYKIHILKKYFVMNNYRCKCFKNTLKIGDWEYVSYCGVVNNRMFDITLTKSKIIDTLQNIKNFDKDV
jgi:hypothetical protein